MTCHVDFFGAQEKTRTSTLLRELAPEASASTNSATWAGVVWRSYWQSEGVSTGLVGKIGLAVVAVLLSSVQDAASALKGTAHDPQDDTV